MTALTIEEKIANAPQSLLIESAKLLANDFREGADLVFEKVLSRLEDTMNDSEFLAFCEEL